MRPRHLLFPVLIILALLSSQTQSIGYAAGSTISATYTPPAGKQGVSDSYYIHYSTTPSSIFDARFQTFKNFGLHTKIYNVWWSELEQVNTPSATAPITCNPGYVLTPANETERINKGYRRYRCLSSAKISQWDNLFQRDAVNGLQTAVVLWSSAPQYRYSNCGGFVWDGGFLKDGCVPRDDAMDDWEDYVNFLANRYSASSSIGKISHFIVWNEAASGAWFDYSPIVPAHSSSITATDRDRWIQKYVDMMQRAHTAIARHTSGVLMHASTDALWTQAPAFDGNHHITTKVLLDGIWARLGTNIDWSVAVHPYGDPIESASSWANFENIALIANYQRDQLVARNVSNPALMPQFKLFASEQGWQQSEGIDVQARNICEAHSLSMRNPALIAQTHYTFQDPHADGAVSYGLVPRSASADLSTGATLKTFEAYRSTGSATWEKRDNHFCCTEHTLGCMTKRPHPMSMAASNNILSGWPVERLMDRDYNTIYSSTRFATSSNSNGTYAAVWLPARSAAKGWMVSTVKLYARMVNGAPMAFPARYRIKLANPANNAWIDIGEYANQPDSSGVATIALPGVYRTWAVMVEPIVMTADNLGHYYFQLNEIEAVASLAYASEVSYDFGGVSATNVLTGWPAQNLIDHRASTAFSSNELASSANTNGTAAAAWLHSRSTVSGVRLTARMVSGIPQAFPARYRLQLTSADNSQWIDLGEFTNQPNASGSVTIALPRTYETWGLHVIPTVLGRDSANRYYFQLAEFELLP